MVNLSSYNYLGFAQNEGPCTDAVIQSIEKFGVAAPGLRPEIGTHSILTTTEKMVAQFVGKDAAMVFGMGFGTNSSMIPALIGPGCLIISDELNHSSLVFGSRVSRANIRVFKHNSTRCFLDFILYLRRHGAPRNGLEGCHKSGPAQNASPLEENLGHC